MEMTFHEESEENNIILLNHKRNQNQQAGVSGAEKDNVYVVT